MKKYKYWAAPAFVVLVLLFIRLLKHGVKFKEHGAYTK